MIEHRIPRVLMILGLTAAVVVYSVLLLQSTDLALGLLVVGLVLLLLLVHPVTGLLVYILFTYTGPQAYVPALANLRVMLVIGGATLGSVLARRVLAGRETQRLWGPQTLFLAWFFLAIVISHVAHLDFGAAAESGVDILSHIVFYILLVTLVSTEHRLARALVVVLVGTVILALQGIAQHLVGGGLLEWQEFRRGRIAGIGHFANPNMLAIALVCGMPIAYSFLTSARSLLIKALMIACMVVMTYALYLTNSRGGMLSYGLMFGLLFARRYGVVAGAILCIVVFLAIFQFGPSRMGTISTEDASAHNRLLAWAKGYEIFGESPVFGAGAGAWYTKYGTLVAHNSFLHCAAELGIFGLIPWVLIIFISFKNLWYVSGHATEEQRRLAHYANAVLLAFSAFLFASFFISKTYNVLIFILVGLSAAIVNIYVNQSDGRFALITGRDFAYGLALTGAGLLVFKVFLVIVGYNS